MAMTIQERRDLQANLRVMAQDLSDIFDKAVFMLDGEGEPLYTDEAIRQHGNDLRALADQPFDATNLLETWNFINLAVQKRCEAFLDPAIILQRDWTDEDAFMAWFAPYADHVDEAMNAGASWGLILERRGGFKEIYKQLAEQDGLPVREPQPAVRIRIREKSVVGFFA